jgi:uracil-DNA glycosylase
MTGLRVVFVGCNPSLKNTSEEPFEGTQSGRVLNAWIKEFGLEESQCAFVNLTHTATKTASALKKSDIDLGKFKFNLMLKCAEVYHGQPTASNMMVAQLQSRGVLDTEMFAELPEAELEKYLGLFNETPMPAIIALGSVAAWGMGKTKLEFKTLPHPSGLNRKLNDKESLQKTLAECRAWLYNEPEPTKGSESAT